MGDPDYKAWARRELTRPGPLADRFVVWEHMLRTSLHDLYVAIAYHLWSVEEDPEYDWGELGDGEWLLEAGGQERLAEVKAYTKGAKAAFAVVRQALEETVGISIEEFVDKMERREALEEGLRAILAQPRRVVAED